MKALRARRSFAQFVRQAWHVLEPTAPLQDNWHIDALCIHLQAAFEGWERARLDPDFEQLIQNLLVNIPPGTAKSRIVSVMFLAWVWLRCPAFRATYLSSNPRVALRDAMYCKDLLESDWYRGTFGITWELRDDANAATRFYNTEGGCRQSNGFMSRITGDRSDAIIWDDPHDAEEVQSDVKRQAVLDRWDSAIGNRLNDLRYSLRIGIMQRLHEDDLSGHVLKEGGWCHLNLPMEWEEERECQCPECVAGETVIGYRDPRRTEGELLFAARFTPSVLEGEKKRLGAYGYAGQMQQRPSPKGGSFFKREWFKIVDAVPAGAKYGRGWDKAGTEDGGAYSVGIKMAMVGERENRRVYITDEIRGQWSSGKRDDIIKQTASLDGRQCRIEIEQEPGSGGKQSAEMSIADLSGYIVGISLVTGDKVTRARPVAIQAEAGNVYLLRGDWNEGFIGEATTFPKGKYKDRIDALSVIFNAMALPSDTAPAYDPTALMRSSSRQTRR